MAEFRRPAVKIVIDLPIFLRRDHVQSIADTVWMHGAEVTFRSKSVEVVLRPKPEDAAAVSAALINAVMASFAEAPTVVAEGASGG